MLHTLGTEDCLFGFEFNKRKRLHGGRTSNCKCSKEQIDILRLHKTTFLVKTAITYVIKGSENSENTSSSAYDGPTLSTNLLTPHKFTCSLGNGGTVLQ